MLRKILISILLFALLFGNFFAPPKTVAHQNILALGKVSAGDQLCGSALVGVACILHNRDDNGNYNFDPTSAPIKTVCGSGYQNINGKDDISISECAGNSLGIFFGSKINKATKCISNLELDWWEIGVSACEVKNNLSTITAKDGVMLGKNATTQINSLTVVKNLPTKLNGKKTTLRIDIENTNPGKVPANIHIQIKGDKNKYYYNPKDNSLYTLDKKNFQQSPNSIQKLLENESVKDGLVKGLNKIEE